jgi:TonB dependent receptor/CarboxypepD_reg-like domain/TonB-dependent Receptor Plug Domain
MQKIFCLLCAMCFTVAGFSQNYTISGTLKDAENGEDLIGATVSVKEQPSIGTAANTYGFYSLTLPKGNYTIVFQYIGYEPLEVPIVLDANQKMDKKLGNVAEKIAEVVIKAEAADRNVAKTEIGVTQLTPKDIETVPVIFGEKDILKTLQLTPGVKTAGEGNAGFYVRGGATDQNLILLDEAPVYNASHLLGFFSVFNSDALKNVTLYKGGIPAEFGGRASSVLDVQMREGNNQSYQVEGGIGAIASRVTFQGPIVKDKGSFIVSGRRTYVDLFTKLSTDKNIKDAVLNFYDLNLKANYQVSKKDRVFVSGYFGRDAFGLGDQFGINWGNATGTARWNHIFNEKLFSNTSFVYSDFDYAFNIGSGDNKISIKSGIKDLNLKQDFSYYLNNKNTLKFGANIISHVFTPSKITVPDDSPFKNFISDIPNRNATEAGFYAQNDHKITDKFSMQYGLRYSLFNFIGEGTAYTFDEEGKTTEKKEYKAGEIIKTYGGWEPRLTANYRLNESSSIKGSYNQCYQYLHLLSNSTTSSPTDLWVPSSNNVKPQIANQVSLGYFKNFADNQFEFSAEAYYKDLQNQIDYKNGAQLTFNATVESELNYGKGRAYGLELYLRKRTGKFTGWIGYTLSRSQRQFEQINNGEWYSAKQDRIHDVSLVAMYELNKKWKLSGTFVYYTGDAVTFPSGRYSVDGKTSVPYYTKRNGSRMPDYHRMDLGATWLAKTTKHYESSWNFSVYNAYAYDNAYSITFQQDPNDATKNQAVQTTLFRIIPSVTWGFKFK